MRAFVAALCWIGLVGGTLAGDVANLTPVPFTAVKFEDEFWAPRIRTTIEKTIPACFDQCEKTGRIANWDKAAKKEGKFEGYFFNDSDVYKVMEAAAYALKLDPNATYKGRKLDEYVDELIAKIAAMQQLDGYVNSYFVLTGEPKWTDIEHKHELYCAGHLIEAAVAHYECTGKLNFLRIAEKLASNICMTFGSEANRNPCGHPEIELALVRLATTLEKQRSELRDAVRRRMPDDRPVLATGGAPPPKPSEPRSAVTSASAPAPKFGFTYDGARKCFEQAWYFLYQRGRKDGREKLWGEYAQDHKPLIEQAEVVGHAVRAMYLFSAATDIARQTGDPALIRVLDSLWRDLTERKMYITGGIGSSASNEGFTTAYDLPNETAYAETCASIGLVFWAHRMNLLHGDAKYFDVLERALYNNVLAAISLDGTQFNYVNPLASRGQHRRQPWHACACCPPNLARLFPTIGGYMYAQDEKSIYVNLYAQSTATFQHGDAKVTIRQEQKQDFVPYPFDGHVSFRITTDRPCDFDLCIRVPDWCRAAQVTINDLKLQAADVKNGYLRLPQHCEGGTGLKVNFPMPVERVQSDPRVKVNIGRSALQRGPIIYCLEAADNSKGVRDIVWPVEAVSVDGPFGLSPLERGAGSASNVGVELGTDVRSEPKLTIRPHRLHHPDDEMSAGPYRYSTETILTNGSAIPYYAWNNRDAGDMIVWIPESPAFLDPQPIAWLKPSASHCWNRDTVAALNDRLDPANSSDAGIPRFTWWPKKGDEQWVQYDFDKPRRISAIEVYWYDDARHSGGCKPPAAWKIQVKKGDAWNDATGASTYGTEDDRFNRVTFDAVESTAIRIVARLADGFSAGILEWKVETD